MTWDNHTCDDCGGQTSGGPCIHNELWATIAPNWKLSVPCDPGDLFSWAGVPCGQRVETFLCFACIERRLGRQLKQEYLLTCAWNAPWIESEVHRRQATAQTENRNRWLIAGT
jgi:hypothetical protein